MNYLSPLVFGEQKLQPESASYNLVLHEHGENLIFPDIFEMIFQSHYLHNLGEAVGFMLSFPSTIAEDLEWSVEDVIKANAELKLLIRWQEPKVDIDRTYGFNISAYENVKSDID
jgi:hypothetical protein